MPVEGVGTGSRVYNEMLQTQTNAVANNSDMSMDDFWQLLSAQLQYQDMTNPMSNSEMMNQMTQMATMNAMTSVSNASSQFSIVMNNLSQVTLTGYSTGMLGKEITVAILNEEGKVVGEKSGVVTGVDLTGAQYVYIGKEKYKLSQIVSVGDVPKKEDGDIPEDGKEDGKEDGSVEGDVENGNK